jgi:hypothetical protein
MDQLLHSLRRRRESVQTRIDEEQARPAPDTLRLRGLKKIRLRFKERIEFIERMTRSGRPVRIPVVRRRSSWAAMPEGI